MGICGTYYDINPFNTSSKYEHFSLWPFWRNIFHPVTTVSTMSHDVYYYIMTTLPDILFKLNMLCSSQVIEGYHLKHKSAVSINGRGHLGYKFIR